MRDDTFEIAMEIFRPHNVDTTQAAMRWVVAAGAAHEANRVLCESHGDTSQPRWEDAPEWQVKAACESVRAVINDPKMTTRRQHELWMEAKRADGWTHGPEKDPAARTHPCLVQYDDLSAEQKAKAELFNIVVRAVLGL